MAPVALPAVSILSGDENSEDPALVSSLADFSRNAARRKISFDYSLGVPNVAAEVFAPARFVPAAKDSEVENGWQMKLEGVRTRVAALLNSFQMSDVSFDVNGFLIPAHKFVLASASPIFYKQFYEASSTDDDNGSEESGRAPQYEVWLASRAKSDTIPIHGVTHLAFFEFLQYLYTDNVTINLENVVSLLFLADEYKVAGLSEKCQDFIRAQVVPSNVLRVIRILRSVLLKACTGMWRELVVQGKALKKFKTLTLAERRAYLDEQDSGSHSRRSKGSSRYSRAYSVRSSASRTRSLRSDTSETVGLYRSNIPESCLGDGDFGDSCIDLAQGFTRKSFKSDQTFKGHLGTSLVVMFVFESLRKCWKCIQEETEHVIFSAEMWQQPETMVRDILRLDTCSVPEISLFRAVSEWAQRLCRERGMQLTPENQRELLGHGTLELIRFPVMTSEQLQWEVIPSGLLKYADVQQLLYVASTRAVTLGRFHNIPRYNVKLQLENRATSLGGYRRGKASRSPSPFATSTAVKEASRTLYNAVTDDPLDVMLAAELLRAFLERRVEAGEVVGPDLSNQPAPALKSRLPSLASTPDSSRARSSPMIASTPESPKFCVRPSRPLSQLEPPSQMALGQLVDEQLVNGMFLKGGGRTSKPEDFVRLCRGLYCFRESRLLELRLVSGEVRAWDHGVRPNCSHPELRGAAPEYVRKVLRVPEALGRGFSLACMLGRQ
jgi:hypothetical protein